MNLQTSWWTRVLMTCTVCALLPASAEAQQAPDPRIAEARERFGEAEELYHRGDLESALAEFTRAYELMGDHPNQVLVLFNIAVCQEELFRYDEALESYRRYLEGSPPDAPMRAEASTRVEALRNRLATLRVQVNVPTAEVWVDNRRVGEAPGDVLVTGGRHVVEVRSEGYSPARQDIQLPARTTRDLEFQLDRAFGGVNPAFAIAGGALTLAAIGVGIGFGAVALAEQSTLNDQLASSDPQDRFRVTPARIEAMEQNALVADIMYGTAGVFAIATLVLVFVTDWGSDNASAPETANLHLAPWGSPHGLGVSLGGSF